MEKNNEQEVGRWVDERLAALAPDGAWQPNVPGGLARLRERLDAKSRPRGRWTWAIAAAVVVGLPLMAFPVTRAFAQRCVSACVGESSRVLQFFTGKGSSPASLAFARPADRKMAPDFTLNDASGKPVTLSDFRGKVVLLNFWATWCAPCRIEIPWFSELQQTYEGRDFVVLGVSLDEDGWTSVKPYMDQHRIGYRVMIGNDDIARLYGGLNSLPTTLIIDRSGRIAVTHVGLCNRSEYEAAARGLVGEQ
jgi:cytochrome c biogenesis protein CcmG/thiol:disulfide interchange protein DsbE